MAVGDKTIEEHFGDLGDLLDGPQYGILAGEGATGQFQIKERINKQGMPVIEIRCQNCGGDMHVIPEWDELMICSNGVTPVDTQTQEPWRMTPDGGWVIPQRCPGCGHMTRTAKVTRDQCMRYVQNGIKSGALAQPYVQQRMAEIQQRARAYR